MKYATWRGNNHEKYSEIHTKSNKIYWLKNTIRDSINLVKMFDRCCKSTIWMFGILMLSCNVFKGIQQFIDWHILSEDKDNWEIEDYIGKDQILDLKFQGEKDGYGCRLYADNIEFIQSNFGSSWKSQSSTQRIK